MAEPRNRNKDRIVQSFREVDLSELRMPVIAVYNHPEDYSNRCVARVYDTDKPTNIVLAKETVEEIEKDIRTNTTFTFFQRGAEDVKSLVGIWW